MPSPDPSENPINRAERLYRALAESRADIIRQTPGVCDPRLVEVDRAVCADTADALLKAAQPETIPDPRLPSISDQQLRELYDFRGLQAEDVIREFQRRGFKLQRKNSSGHWSNTEFTSDVSERFISAVSCGHSEPESEYRDPDTGAHRTARCEGGRLIVRGNGLDSVTDGTLWMGGGRPCPKCEERAL